MQAGERLAGAVEGMRTLNRAASEVFVARGVRAATDVTGFGLLGQVLADLGFVSIAPKTRFDRLGETGLISARIAGGTDPYGSSPARRPGAFLRLRSRLSRSRSEFITLICRKPQ